MAWVVVVGGGMGGAGMGGFNAVAVKLEALVAAHRQVGSVLTRADLAMRRLWYRQWLWQWSMTSNMGGSAFGNGSSSGMGGQQAMGGLGQNGTAMPQGFGNFSEALWAP